MIYYNFLNGAAQRFHVSRKQTMKKPARKENLAGSVTSVFALENHLVKAEAEALVIVLVVRNVKIRAIIDNTFRLHNAMAMSRSNDLSTFSKRLKVRLLNLVESTLETNRTSVKVPSATSTPAAVTKARNVAS